MSRIGVSTSTRSSTGFRSQGACVSSMDRTAQRRPHGRCKFWNARDLGIYLQLFWKGFNPQLRANILINRGAGSGLAARCLDSNMSSEAVFIEAVILVLRRGQEEWSSTTTNLSGMEGGDGAEPGETGMHKGPLASGSYTDIRPCSQGAFIPYAVPASMQAAALTATHVSELFSEGYARDLRTVQVDPSMAVNIPFKNVERPETCPACSP